jgi:hypothetical protein
LGGRRRRRGQGLANGAPDPLLGDVRLRIVYFYLGASIGDIEPVYDVERESNDWVRKGQY